jgi:hypothetical protein
MDMDIKRIVLLPTLLLVASAVCSQPAAAPDIGTYFCLAVDEPDPTVEVCKRLYPAWESQLLEARRKWEGRNAADLKMLRSACQTHLERAYDGDEARIRFAKQAARDSQAAMMQDVISGPHPDGRVNCRAYVKDFSEGTPRVDGLGEQINVVRESTSRMGERKK